jgi:hypothetical protein
MADKADLLREKISKQGPLINKEVLHLEFELVAIVVAQAIMNPSEHPFGSRNVISS